MQVLQPERFAARAPLRAVRGAALILVLAASVTVTLRPGPLAHPARPVGAPASAAVQAAADAVRLVREQPRSTVLPAQPRQDAAAMPLPAAVAPATVPTAAPAPIPPAPAVRGPQIGFFLGGPWLENHRESALYSEPRPDALQFTTLPQWSSMRQMETRPGWVKVYFQGDREGRQPGEAWVPAADVGPVVRPAIWGTALATSPVWQGPAADAAELTRLPANARVETLGPLQDGRVEVRFPGDGRSLAPGTGWVDVARVQPVLAPRPAALPWGYPETAEGKALGLFAPYRSQLDGSSYAAANCGPATISMALAAFGVDASPGSLRAQVQDVQGEWGDDAGSYVWALGRVVQQHWVGVSGLYDGQPKDDLTGPLHHWTVGEIRQQLSQGRVVVVQVYYRNLPGREEVAYWGDHYVLITGTLGNSFLYNDPIDSDGVGYDRVMYAETLTAAMENSSSPGAGFAVGR